MVEYSKNLRRFRETIEPITASVYFAPEPLQALGALGLTPMEAYFCGRSAPMGRVEGAVVSSVFTFFEPSVARAATDGGWKKVDPADVLQARLEGVSACMARLIGSGPDGAARKAAGILLQAMESVPDAGRPLFAAWKSVQISEGDENLKLWRACDLFREHRGAAHSSAWLVSGLRPREAVVLSKHWWGLESNTYLAVHGWSQDDIAEAEEALESLGHLEAGRISRQGVALRDEIEDLTDRMQKDVAEAVQGRLDELTEALVPTRDAVVEAGGYPLQRVPSRP